MTRLLRTLGAAALLTALAGCTAAGTATMTAREPSYSAQQRDALKDGDVSWDEYKTSFDAYVACLQRKGYELADIHVENDLFTAGVPGAAVDSGADDECYGYNWSRVDDAWQIAHEDTSESARLVSACLRSRNVAPSPSYQKNLELLKQHGIELADCPADG